MRSRRLIRVPAINPPIERASLALGLGFPDAALTADDFQTPIIYAWMRGDECLYIGQSRIGLRRIFLNHHAITLKSLLPDDRVLIWLAPKDEAERCRLEQALIARMRPTLNREFPNKKRPALPPMRKRATSDFRSPYWLKLRGGCP